MHWVLPEIQSHALVMTLGFMPFFFTGFLFTAGPKWLRRPAVPAHTLMTPVVAQVSGWLVFLLGANGPDPAFGSVLGGLGLAAVATGWTQVWWRFVTMLRASGVADRTHARIIAAAGGIGALSMWTASAAVAMSDISLLRIATLAGLWFFVGVVFVTVTHRMTPFFGVVAVPVLDAWRPMWLLWTLVGTIASEGAFVVGEALFGAFPPHIHALQGIVETCAGAGLLTLAIRWGLAQSMSNRLLAMLHVAFMWLGLSFILAALSHALSAVSGGEMTLGVAPLHAYTMGFLGSTLIATATRVSSGHGGRTVAADRVVWSLFWVLQCTVLARVAAAVLAASGSGGAVSLIAVAAVGWCVVCVAWALRYGRWFGTPRPDGRPG